MLFGKRLNSDIWRLLFVIFAARMEKKLTFKIDHDICFEMSYTSAKHT